MSRRLQKLYASQSRQWTHHFQNNLDHMDHVPWEDDLRLTEKEKSAIARSVATFQLGENAEGNAFKQAGRRYAERTGDYEYLTALRLFIEEEQRHSAVLGRFMDAHHIPRLHKEWTDSVFRFVRKIAGLNVCVTVLLTAEIVAAVYYRALGQATRSPVLRAICGQILIDEAHHLRFQSGTLAKERRGWWRISRWLFEQLQRLFMAGTILVVWKEHRAVFRAGNLGFLQTATAIWSVLEDVLATIRRGVDEYSLPTPVDTSVTVSPKLPSMHLQKVHRLQQASSAPDSMNHPHPGRLRLQGSR